MSTREHSIGSYLQDIAKGGGSPHANHQSVTAPPLGQPMGQEMLVIPKIRTLNRGRLNSVLRARRRSSGDLDTIDAEEAAQILGKSTKSLQRWRAIGYGPPFRLDGRYVSYSRAEVEAWKAEHDVKRTPSACLNKAVQLTSVHNEA